MPTEPLPENEPRTVDARPRPSALKKLLFWIAAVVLFVFFGFPILATTLLGVWPPGRIFTGDYATAVVRSRENPIASPSATPGPSETRPVATVVTR
jgi:hypothetical protein